MTEARSKAALLQLIERQRGLWDDLLAEIGEERMLQPGATGDWSFKGALHPPNLLATKCFGMPYTAFAYPELTLQSVRTQSLKIVFKIRGST